MPAAGLLIAKLAERAKPTAKDESKRRQNRDADDEPKHGTQPLVQERPN
jgi:hypothetical protein